MSRADVSRRRHLAMTLALAGVGLLTGACVADDPVLTEAGAQGRQVATDNGCMSCHGVNGEGGVGPAWGGLHGREVTFDDGTVTVADDDYLREAILDPGARQVDGYTVMMPENSLTVDEADAIITYIKELE